MKLVLPMAGYGSRLRPHTWSKPKPLVSVAGKPVLAHLMDSFQQLPGLDEAVLIVGYLGDQIRRFVAERYPQLNARFVVQEELKGQSHAIWLAREGLQGPTLIAFVDTLIDADFSGLGEQGVVWVKRVDDPRRFGVVVTDAEGRIQRLVEKPQEPVSDLAVVGFYYFPDGAALIDAIQSQMESGEMLKGEYFLADAINLLLQDGLDMRTETVLTWHDSGTAPALLETNRYLLAHGHCNDDQVLGRDDLGTVQIEPPVYVDQSASLHNSQLGPYASIGPDCRIENSQIRDSIVEAGAHIRSSQLSDSLIGRNAVVENTRGVLNVGDNARVQGADEVEG